MAAVQTRPSRAGIPNVWSFILIILGFVLSNAVSLHEMRNSQAQVRLIAQYAATDIDLAARLSRDLDRKRSLIESHILEKEPADMDRIEAELAHVDADIASALRSYRPIGEDAEETTAWQQLEAGMATIDPEIFRAISLSSMNRDGEAQTAVKSIEAQFNAVDQAVNKLLRLNHARADQQAGQVHALQLRAAMVLIALTLAWTTFALVTARWVTRLLADREGQMKQALILLEERNRELDAFAGRVAHDIRGPLTTINLAASHISQRLPREDGTGDILRRGVGRMEAIIQDLLALARIGTQTMGATCEATDVLAFVQDDLTPEVEAVGGVLRVEGTPATLPCNSGLLRQVLWNLAKMP
jgi:hypothetical protein